ncbi:hypothetical protein REPUB_Repub01dG0096600 [Reevesia pubescens]
MDPDVVAKAFVEHYYSTFDAIQGGLANLYQDGSMLTFEGPKIQGSQNFVAMLTGLPFQQCQHNISTVDCQPSGAGSMLVFVFGTLQLAYEQHALQFSKTLAVGKFLWRDWFYQAKRANELGFVDSVSVEEIGGSRVTVVRSGESGNWVAIVVL